MLGGETTGPECARPGCHRPAWRGMEGNFCGRSCRTIASRASTLPWGGVMSTLHHGGSTTLCLPIAPRNSNDMVPAQTEYCPGCGHETYDSQHPNTLPLDVQYFRPCPCQVCGTSPLLAITRHPERPPSVHHVLDGPTFESRISDRPTFESRVSDRPTFESRVSDHPDAFTVIDYNGMLYLLVPLASSQP
jgi:hypothetical protein